MLLRRIAVRNFRRLASPVLVEDLGNGITIIAGDNEEGKSTLLDAIRTCLFERHNLGGKAVEAMQPFGSKVRPEIELGFAIDGKAYSIAKAFAQNPSATLITPDGTFQGSAAEERLAELLRFRIAQRGESKPDDQGILGLFWLEQGRALEGLRFGEAGRSTLRRSLEEEVGDVLGGTRGSRLLQAAKNKLDELFTPKTREPKGRLKETIREAEIAEKRVDEYEKKRQAYDEDIDELTRLRRELARIANDRVLERAEGELAEAEEQARVIEKLRQQDSTAGVAVSLANAELAKIRDRWSRRKELIEVLECKEGALKSAHETLAGLAAATKDIAAQLGAAEEALATAEEIRNVAEARAEQSQNRARLEELDKEIAKLEQDLEAADNQFTQRTEAQEILAGIKIDKKAFECIQNLENEFREARAALGAIATRVRFLPSADQAIWKNGDEVQAGDEIELTAAARFMLEGFGAVEVAPGAAALADRRAKVKNIENALNKALFAASVQTVAQAKSQLADRAEAEDAVKGADRLIAVHAPKGIDALKSAHKEKALERNRSAQYFDPSLAADLGDPETEKRGSVSAKAAEKAAREARDAAQKNHHAHTTALAVAKEKLRGAEEGAGAAKEELEAAQAQSPDADLFAGLETASAALSEKEDLKSETGRRLAAAKPEETELRRKRAAETLKSVTAEREQLHRSANTAEGRLMGLGQSGFGELLDEARGAKDRVIAGRDRLQAEADAWNLLVMVLSEAEREAKEAFLQPVRERVSPFLRLLLPGVSIKIDEETFEIVGLARDGRVEPYEKLSGGMREQLSILVRLAFAVYLREKGYPAAVILDDALVYADPDRFDRMQLALRKAAEIVQILILTCNPAHWRAIGAPIRRLADGKAKAVPSFS